MSKKSKNSMDIIYESLVSKLESIPNVEEFLKEPTAVEFLLNFVFRYSVIKSFQNLVNDKFLRATQSHIQMNFQKLKSSKHFDHRSFNKEHMEILLFEVLRSFYIVIFPKYENFIKEGIKPFFNELFKEKGSTSMCIFEVSKQDLQFDFTDWYNFTIVKKVNAFTNCIKHNDAAPSLKAIREFDAQIDCLGRIKITRQIFNSDCDSIVRLYMGYIEIAVCVVKYMHETKNNSLQPEELQAIKTKASQEIKNIVRLYQTQKT